MSVPTRLRREAERFRDLAERVDGDTAAYLLGLADEYEAEADEIDYDVPLPLPRAQRRHVGPQPR